MNPFTNSGAHRATGKVNIDYICAIFEKDGKTVFETVDIPQSVEDISKLEAMVENDNEYLVDMQAQMNNYNPNPQTRIPLDYVSPHEYNEAYIDQAKYPEILTYNEYMNLMLKKEAELKQTCEALFGNLRESDPEGYKNRLEAYVSKGLFEFDKLKKTEFFIKAKRYINAQDYYCALIDLNQRPDLRMYSTDTLGWTSFSYKVTEDISITLNTNFGYGRSAYFALNLIYKGIKILPYSVLVRYYYANMWDIIRYTRLYDLVHDSWNVAFAFVEDVANQAAASPSEFLEKWVLNEVKEMVRGLHAILENPSMTIREMVYKTGRVVENGYLLVRNMSYDEKSTYGVYPEEMTMAVKAEKITGALQFLSNLTELSKLLPDIEGFIEEIKHLAVSLIPSLDHRISAINSKLQTLRHNKDVWETELANIEKELDAHEQQIEQIESFYKEIANENFTKEKLYNMYEQGNAEYRKLKAQKNEHVEKINRLTNEIRMRQNFVDQLTACRQRVVDAGLVKAA